MTVWTCGKCGTINTTAAKNLTAEGHAICRSCGERMLILKPERTVSS